jgi:hypothetical protein
MRIETVQFIVSLDFLGSALDELLGPNENNTNQQSLPQVMASMKRQSDSPAIATVTCCSLHPFPRIQRTFGCRAR